MERVAKYLTLVGLVLLVGATGAWMLFYVQLRNAIPVTIEAALPCLFATSNDCLAGLQLTGATTSPLAFWAGFFLVWLGGSAWMIAFAEREGRTFVRR